MIELRTLGSTALTDSAGRQVGRVLRQPKRLALLSYLVVARPQGFHRRSTLLALFWPERDEQHARWSLNQALRALRRGIGGDVLQSRGQDEVGIDRAMLWCDAVAFSAACDKRAWTEAMGLYQGDLLSGLFVSRCPEFEHWLEEERRNLRRKAAAAALALAEEAENARELSRAAKYVRRAVALTPGDEPRMRRLIRLLDSAGNRAGAMQAYAEYREWLDQELDVQPSPETKALVADIRARGQLHEKAVESPRVGEPQDVGVDRGGSGTRGPASTVPARSRWPRLLLLTSAPLIGGALILWAFVSPPRPRLSPDGIAVLPCVQRAQEGDLRHHPDLMTAELISEIARSRAFEKVIAHQSVSAFRASNERPEVVAAQLGVNALVYCELERSDEVELLRVQLVDGESGALLWSEDFHHDLAGTPSADVAAFAADRLAARAGKRPQAVPAPGTRDLEALNLFKEGQYHLVQAREETLRESIDYFNAALARDSGFARPYVGLARAYLHLGIAFGSMEPRVAFPLVKRAADQALEHDPGMAEAHVQLGIYQRDFGWDWTAAERHFRKAVELNPYSPHALQGLAYQLAVTGRHHEAAGLDTRAVSMSPLDPTIWAAAARNHVLAGRFGEARELMSRALRLGPELPPTLLVGGILYSELGDFERGLDYLERADSASAGQVIIRGRLGYAYALSGDTIQAQAILAGLREQAADPGSRAKAATAIGVVHIGLAQVDSAFDWLDIAVRERSANVAHVLRTPAGWRLSSDPRYEALLRRVGLVIPPDRLVPSRQDHRR